MSSRLESVLAAVIFAAPLSFAQAPQVPSSLTQEKVAALKKDASLCGPYVVLVDELIAAGRRQRQADTDAAFQNLGRPPIARASIDDELIKLKVLYDDLPFYVEISGPCAQAAVIIERAQRRYEEPVLPSVDDLNRDGVKVHVRPARIAETAEQKATEQLITLMTKVSVPANLAFERARVIDNVIIKQGTDVVRPAKKVERPLQITTSTGGAKAVNEADFYFPVSTFAPTGDLLFVLIAGDRIFEVPVSANAVRERIK